MDANNIIGSTLSDELFRIGMTPATLASAIGISQYEVEQVCNGVCADTTIVRIISLALGINLFRPVSDTIDCELN